MRVPPRRRQVVVTEHVDGVRDLGGFGVDLEHHELTAVLVLGLAAEDAIELQGLTPGEHGVTAFRGSSRYWRRQIAGWIGGSVDLELSVLRIREEAPTLGDQDVCVVDGERIGTGVV